MSLNKDVISHTDSKFTILSPRPKASLLTSVTQIRSPTTFPQIYTSNEHKHQLGILDKLPNHITSNLAKTDNDNDALSNTGGLTEVENEITPEYEGLVYNGTVMNERRPADSLDFVEGKIRGKPNYPDCENQFLNNLERQIVDDITENGGKKLERTGPVEAEDFTSKDDNYLWKHDKRDPCEGDNDIVDELTLSARSRSHTSSMSSIGTHDSASLSTRCSACDGCSSSGSNRQSQNQKMNPISNCRHNSGCSDRSLYWSDISDSSSDMQHIFKQRSNDSYSHLLHLTDAACSSKIVDTGTYDLSETITASPQEVPSGRSACPRLRHNCVRHKGAAVTQNALGNLVVMTMWVQLSRYRELQNENTHQKKAMSNFEKKMESLILVILMLTNHLTNSTSKLEQFKLYLEHLKEKQKKYEKNQRRLYFGFTCLTIVCLLQVSPIRRRCLSLLRFIGIFETINKLNRARKVASENWRNIPSLLTDFWRIFTFRSRSRLRDRFS